MNVDLGLADLNIDVNRSSTSNIRNMVLRAFELGYQTVALNTIVNQEDMVTRKKKNKCDDQNKLSEFPEPTRIDINESDYPELKNRGILPKILTRLTIVMFDNDFLIHYNKSEVVKQYDLLSIIPKTDKCLQAVLKSSFRFDILSLHPDLIYGVKWQRKLYNECVEKYVHFELMYAPLITDRESRRKIINLAHSYKSAGKSRKIFISSGASSPIDLRSPSDVANLAFIFGLTENQGRDAVKKHCTDIYRSALGRKIGVYRVRVEKLGNVDIEDNSSDSDSMDTD